MKKKIVYIDMDGVLCDFEGAVEAHPDKDKFSRSRVDTIPGIYSDLNPMPGAIEAFEKLFEDFDVYILSTPPWRNPDAWNHKREWIEKYIPKAKRRLILSHHKNLNKGDILIDDTNYRGQSKFEGEWIHFGKGKFKGWSEVLEYIYSKYGNVDKRWHEYLNDDYVLDN
jgi:5'-nucleotidase|tara:strand:- start:170 stop:673 length:504 start_codon:yes stop_codon:yes gene_type:complete